MHSQRFRRADSRITLSVSPMAIATLGAHILHWKKLSQGALNSELIWLNYQQFFDHSLRFSKISVDELRIILPFLSLVPPAIIHYFVFTKWNLAKDCMIIIASRGCDRYARRKFFWKTLKNTQILILNPYKNTQIAILRAVLKVVLGKMASTFPNFSRRP